MPDRELPEDLVARLSDELISGAPLVAPLPSQARYASAALPVAPGYVRWRLVSAAGAAAALIVIAVAAGPTPARQWIGDSVGNLTRGFEAGGDHRSASPSPGGSPASQPSTIVASPHESPEATESPEPAGSPEPGESPEPSQTPQSHESPEPSQSPDGDGQQPSPGTTQSPEPSDGGGTDGGGGG